jgi:hypothetical protein
MKIRIETYLVSEQFYLKLNYIIINVLNVCACSFNIDRSKQMNYGFTLNIVFSDVIKKKREKACIY